jgi:hypothetical protein
MTSSRERLLRTLGKVYCELGENDISSRPDLGGARMLGTVTSSRPARYRREKLPPARRRGCGGARPARGQFSAHLRPLPTPSHTHATQVLRIQVLTTCVPHAADIQKFQFPVVFRCRFQHRVASIAIYNKLQLTTCWQVKSYCLDKVGTAKNFRTAINADDKIILRVASTSMTMTTTCSVWNVRDEPVRDPNVKRMNVMSTNMGP